MKIEKIKPIPKYIEKLIKKRDLKDFEAQNGINRFYSYLTKNDGELVKVTVAVKNRHKKWYCKQVAVHGVHSDVSFSKDLNFFYTGGYTVGWWEEGFYKQCKWWEGDGWYQYRDKELDPHAPCVNIEYALKQKEYQYSAIDQYTHCDLFKYLRLYEIYPEMEYITKLGLSYLATRKQILDLARKSKAFRKWIGKNSQEIRKKYYYVTTIIQAFKKNKPMSVIQAYEQTKKHLINDYYYPKIKGIFNNDMDKLINYLAEKNIRLNLYVDYISACRELGLDITETKHRYPHDFMRWHDVRIDENNTRKALEDAKKNKQMYEQFSAVAEKFLPLERNREESFVVIIAKSPTDLKKEGSALQHCVGGSNYSQKFIRQESLIFFIREKDNIEKPYVTVEYSIADKKIIQCYGKNNTNPQTAALDFINKKWLPCANRKVNKLVA